MRILLRCDSTKFQGLGHVIRTMAVAEAALAAGHDVHFAGNVESPVGRQLIEKLCSAVYPGPEGPEDVAELARRIGADLVHIDTYVGQGALLTELRKVSILLSSMEDGTFGRRQADLVVDPSPGAELLHRPDDGSFRLFRGARAIPIRRSIIDRQAGTVPEAEPGSLKQIMIIMGGTDARDMTARCVGLWARSGVPSRCFVVDPSGHRSFDVVPADGQVLEVVQPSLDVPDLFTSMDLVISGSGTTTWELATLGVPMALLQLVDNQAENYAFAVGNGMALGLGDVSGLELDDAEAVEALTSLLLDDSRRAELGAQARRVVDGLGADRIVMHWEELAAREPGVSVRVADIDDAGILFDWRNEPSVREVSREKGELSWDSHVAWVGRALQNPEVCLLIAQFDGMLAGTVRFHALDAQVWEVSITLAPEMRGRGKALEILTAAERYFLKQHPDAALHAAMLESNKPSYTLFRNAGYEGYLDETGGERWYRLIKPAGKLETS